MDLRIPDIQIQESLMVSHQSMTNQMMGWDFVILPDSHTVDDIADLLSSIFSQETVDSGTIKFCRNVDMFDVLVQMGAFKSKGDARNNWKKSDKNIDNGCHAFLVGKKMIPLFIWKVPETLEKST